MDTPKPQRHLLERSAAFLIDGLITAVLLSIPLIVILIASSLTPGKPLGEQTPSDLFGQHYGGIGLAVILTSIGLGFGYFLLRDGLSRGSLGKRLFGLIVVDHQTGIPSRYMKSITRNLVILLLHAIELLVPFCTPSGRRLGDYLAQTVVVKHGAKPGGLQPINP